MELKRAYQSIQPFRTQDEYLYAMKEDLAEWLNRLYDDAAVTVIDFYERLEDGVTLCRHANNVRRHMLETSGDARYPDELPDRYPSIYYRTDVRTGTFRCRDNVANFIGWCRNILRVPETVLFETDDLVLRKNGRNFVLCLLEVARRGSRFGLPVPVIVQLEQEIDAEIASERDQNSSVCLKTTDRRHPQIEADLKTLEHLVRDVLGRCTCPDQFPMIRVSDGKYRIGESLTTVFLRILRSHVMVRIGGGWDTLENYLNRHDPCRCQSKSAHGSLIARSGGREREKAKQLQQHLENSTTFKTDPKRSNTGTYAAAAIQNVNRDANPHILKKELDGMNPKSGVPGKLSAQSPDIARRTQSKPGSDKLLNSSASVSTNRTTEAGDPLLLDRDPGPFGRQRRISMDSFHSESRLPPSSDRRGSGVVGEQDLRWSPSKARAPCFARGTSRERSVAANTGDVLLVTRDRRGLHSVHDLHRDSSRSEIQLIAADVRRDRNVNSASPRLSGEICRKPTTPRINHPARSRQQQQNWNCLPPIKPLALQRSLSESMGEREKEGDDIPYPTTQDRNRSTSFSAFSAIEKTSTSDQNAGFDSPLSPTESEFLLEECRRLGLGIRNLIDREEIFSTGISKDRRESSETEAKQTEPWQNEAESEPSGLRQPTAALKFPKTSSKFNSNSNRNRFTSKEYFSDVATCNSNRFSSPSSLAVRLDIRGSSSGIYSVPQNLKADKQGELERLSYRHINNTETSSTSQSGTLNPVSPCPKNSVTRTQNKTEGEPAEVETTKPRNRSCEPQCSPLRSENLLECICPSAKRRNLEATNSLCSDIYVTGRTSPEPAADQFTRVKVVSKRSRYSSVGDAEISSSDWENSPDFLLNWDDYRKRVLSRKVADQGHGPTTRIPMPLEVKGSSYPKQLHKNLNRPKSIDSADNIDIHRLHISDVT